MHQRFLTAVFTVLILFSSFPTSAAQEQPLARRASWQASFSAAPVGRILTEIGPDSALQAAGVEVGDIFLAVDGRLILDSASWDDITDALVAGRDYHMRLRRGSQSFTVTLQFNPLPQEAYPNLRVEYGQITNDYGIRQRTIVTKPQAVRQPLPALFVLQGLSCSSIEYTPGRDSNFIRLLQDLVTQSNALVMRVEKPGLGDSEGDCSQTDFATELNGYARALETLLARDDINPEKVFIYGSSMGSALAPYFANRYPIAGIIADGTFYRSWFEHMLEIERRIKGFQGNSQAEVSRQIREAYISLYYGMLVQKKSYAELIQANPLLAPYNYHAPEHMYGRPMVYYHQLQDFDVAGEWSKLTAPVRIRWGTHDWIMSEYDNDILLEVLAENGHTDFELYKHPGLDHWDTLHHSAKDSFDGKPGVWDARISGVILDWLAAWQ